MSRIAYIENGIVKNTALGDEAFAAATGGVVCDLPVSPRWRYDGTTFSPPPDAPEDPPAPVDQLGFRQMFTFAEAQAEAVYRRQAEALVAGPAPDPNDTAAVTGHSYASTYLAMQDDFRSAGMIHLDHETVGAALDFFIAFGIIEASRKAEIQAGVKQR